MSSSDEAPAIKLYNNKKEQEMYENYAGELSCSIVEILRADATDLAGL